MYHTVCATACVLALGAALAGHANAAVSLPAGLRESVVEQPASVSFEYDVRVKALPTQPDLYRAVYEAAWNTTMRTCDARGGYLSEYHDGHKRSAVDTLDMGARASAYATCRIEPGAEGPLDGMHRPVEANLVSGNGINSSLGVIQARGDKQAAYHAVRTKAYQTCLDNSRRVRFLSLASRALQKGGDMVEARFACNSDIMAASLLE